MKKIVKRGLCLCLLLALVLGALSGCGPQKSSMMDENGNITLDFWSIYPEGDPNYDWMVKTIRNFEKENPKIKIN